LKLDVLIPTASVIAPWSKQKLALNFAEQNPLALCQILATLTVDVGFMRRLCHGLGSHFPAAS